MERKMRLIDADALDMYERLKSYYGNAWRDAQEEIDNAPTVDAIPIEWLQAHVTTIEQQRLLDEWAERKEK